ncbi:MAG: zinc ribbon domain-containing protein [Oscillospiraceae bacterium]|nr:zinc ribbon domain-containing protein [Oscillospiraceae bacterium]
MFCEKCGSPLSEGAKFCKTCGAGVVPPAAGLTCKVCGAAASEGMAFCEVCGARLQDAGAPAQVAAQPDASSAPSYSSPPAQYAPPQSYASPAYTPPPASPAAYAPSPYAAASASPAKPKSRKKAVIISVLILVVLLSTTLVLVLTLGSSNSPEGVVLSFCEAAFSGDISTAVDKIAGIDEIIDYAIDSGEVSSRREAINAIESELNLAGGMSTYLKGLNLKFEIVGKREIFGTARENALEEYGSTFWGYYSYNSIQEARDTVNRISRVYEVQVSLSFGDSSLSELLGGLGSELGTAYVGLYNGKWGILSLS